MQDASQDTTQHTSQAQRSHLLPSCFRHHTVPLPLPNETAIPARKKILMPKVKLAPFIEEIHGTLYDMVFKKSPQGEMIVTKKPDMSKVKWSKAQKANRKHMSTAIAITQAALLDPKVKAKYERKAKKLGRRAWNLALSDALNGKDLRAKR
jgi:hypothetical protein